MFVIQRMIISPIMKCLLAAWGVNSRPSYQNLPKSAAASLLALRHGNSEHLP